MRRGWVMDTFKVSGSKKDTNLRRSWKRSWRPSRSTSSRGVKMDFRRRWEYKNFPLGGKWEVMEETNSFT
jgi:hypothetical protein